MYVTDDKLVRNSKLLLALARGVSVVGVNWIEESQKERQLITDNIDKYLLHDVAFEKQYGCKLTNLYKQSNKTSQLLKGQRVYISSNIVILSKPHMIQLIKSIGADLVGETEKDAKTANVCFVDENKDKKIVTALKAIKKDRPVISNIIALFDGILKQQIDFDGYEPKF